MNSSSSTSEKLQKILARAGLGSRRQIEIWIQAGRVTINGRIAQLGERATLNDKITLDGKPCRVSIRRQKARVLLYHKPAGQVCSRSDPEKRPTVFENLPLIHSGRWISIGRLDYNTSGLLMFTNDGELANRLMHPSTQIEREYAVRIMGRISAETTACLIQGIKLADGLARFNTIKDGGGEGVNHWYHVTVKEGRNRLVRRLFESQGIEVTRLIRVRFGIVTLPRFLRLGGWMEMPEDQILKL